MEEKLSSSGRITVPQRILPTNKTNCLLNRTLKQNKPTRKKRRIEAKPLPKPKSTNQHHEPSFSEEALANAFPSPEPIILGSAI